MTALKLRSKVNFPATVNATGGLAVSKSNGIWTVQPDWSYLSLETVIPDAAGRQLWTLDPATNTYYRLSVQALIDNLPDGPAGATGPTGPTAGIRQAYSTTTTDSDPGAGTFRLNNATPASATAAYLDNVDAGGATVSTIFDLFDDSTTTTKGYLRFEKSGDPTVWAQFAVTGSVVDGTGYRKITLTSGAGSGTFTNGDTFAITFYRSGDKGADGLGTGDFSSNTATSVDGEAVVFSGTAGKTGKRFAATGIVKAASGVLSAATAGTDYAGPVANPTATIGLTAVNGSATGAMRSDAAPALSQAIVPTWTGLHTFTANIALTSAAASIEMGQVGSSNTPYIDFHSSASSTDYDTRIIASGGSSSVGEGTLTFLGIGFRFDGQTYSLVDTITDGANLSWVGNVSQKAKVTLGGNRTMLAVSGAIEGASYFLWVIQDGTGSRTITWTTSGAGSFDFGTDGAPTLTTTANRADLLCFEAISIGGTLKLRYAGIKKGFA